MKYTEETYINCGFYERHDERNYKAQVVKIRFDRECVNCRKQQARGQQMLCETAILEDEGRVCAYTCLPCLDKWIDAHPQLIIR